MRSILAFVLSAAALSAASPAAAGDARADAALRRVQALDARLATVGHRLAIANLDLCPARQWRWGFTLADVAALEDAYRAAAIRAFGVESGLVVTALAGDGAAERAGLRAGDLILALDGTAAQATPASAGRQGARSTREMLAPLVAAFADGSAAVEVLRGGERLTLQIPAERSCATLFRGVASDSHRAWADGETVGVSTGLIEYAADDAELAAVVAHEFAHNILRHRVRLEGVSRGFLGIGRDNRRIRETEIEADRLSVYLMERAGYDPEAAIRFWRRFGPHPFNFLRVADHPGWRQRIRLFEAEIERIRAERAAGRAPFPDFWTPQAAAEVSAD